MSKVPPICLIPDGTIAIFKMSDGPVDGQTYRSDVIEGDFDHAKVYWNATQGGQVGKVFNLITRQLHYYEVVSQEQHGNQVTVYCRESRTQ